MATFSSFLPWKSYGQRSLVSYSPRGGKESDTTEHTHTQAYNVLYTCYTHVIGLRVYLHVCLFVSLSLS